MLVRSVNPTVHVSGLAFSTSLSRSRRRSINLWATAVNRAKKAETIILQTFESSRRTKTTVPPYLFSFLSPHFFIQLAFT